MLQIKLELLPEVNNSIERNPNQQVYNMICMGYMATDDGKCDAEMKGRIGIARSTFENMSKVLNMLIYQLYIQNYW